MGLDQYVYSCKSELIGDKQVDFEVERECCSEVFYWRKHPNIQGWMERLYREKGGSEEFNCVNLRLVEEDLDRLELYVKGGLLPETKGFFFGKSYGDEDEKQRDLKFIAAARDCLERGEAVFYSPWW